MVGWNEMRFNPFPMQTFLGFHESVSLEGGCVPKALETPRAHLYTAVSSDAVRGGRSLPSCLCCLFCPRHPFQHAGLPPTEPRDRKNHALFPGPQRDKSQRSPDSSSAPLGARLPGGLAQGGTSLELIVDSQEQGVLCRT